MGRVIKFRAWNKSAAHPNMIDVEQVTYDECGGLSHVSGWCVDPDNGGEQTLSSDQFELMQFTGLTDKNGVDVYEGDVVKKDSIVCEVIFSKKAAKFCVRLPSHQWFGVVKKVYSIIGVEVIGNIHQHPELLSK